MDDDGVEDGVADGAVEVGAVDGADMVVGAVADTGDRPSFPTKQMFAFTCF